MKNALIIAITLASLVLIFSIGHTMSGMLIYDDNVKELCQSNDDCTDKTQVCCPFDGESAGVCDTQARCADISKLSSSEPQLQQPARVESSGSVIIAGTIFILTIALALTITFYKIKHKIHQHKENKQQLKAKTSKISSKGKDSKIVATTSLYDKIFPISIKIDNNRMGLYITLIVLIVGLIAILMMILE